MICEICQFHHTRLAVILKTWFNLAPQNTYFFTGKELFRDIPIYENLGQLLLWPAYRVYLTDNLRTKVPVPYRYRVRYLVQKEPS